MEKFLLAQQPYSTLVAGIYSSTKPGVLGATRRGRTPMRSSARPSLATTSNRYEPEPAANSMGLAAELLGSTAEGAGDTRMRLVQSVAST